MASLDAARQLFATEEVQKLFIPADPPHDKPSHDVEQELDKVRAHLNPDHRHHDGEVHEANGGRLVRHLAGLSVWL